MVFIDFSNPFVVENFPVWLESHKEKLDRARRSVAEWAETSRSREQSSAATRPLVAARPLAAVFDIDEVILCNLRAAPGSGTKTVEEHFPPPRYPPARFADTCAVFPTWPPDSVWSHATASRSGYNPVLPGATELLVECRRAGMDIFLVTGRHEYLRAETVENFDMLGLLGAGTGLSADLLERGGRLLMVPPHKTDKGANPLMSKHKAEVRAKIEETHRIALNIGDQLSDLGAYGDVQYLVGHSYYFTP